MYSSLLRFVADDSGAEVVEFAIILASFSIVTMLAIAGLGTTASGNVNNASNSLTNGALYPP